MAYLTHDHTRPVATKSSRILPVSAMGRLFSLWRSRRALSELEPHMLDDIGVSPKAATREANKPIWDVPQHWID